MKSFASTLFPYGRVPLWLLLAAILSGLGVLAFNLERTQARADLVLAVFSPQHFAAYERIIPEFERQHGVGVHAELVTWRALRGRLQNALLVGADVPDVIELAEDSMGYYTRGPVSDIGFVDLTQRIEQENLRERMVASRFGLWSSRGHVFALPHDVHPVMLAYRRDLVESLGIDVRKLRTWDDFVRMGRKVTRDLDGDGVIDRYALDLLMTGGWSLRVLLKQRGGALVDEHGSFVFDSEQNARTIEWYIHQTYGPERIAFEFGWGQPLAKALVEGLALFYIATDWRLQIFATDVPRLEGKLAVMPLPAWTPGGRRTSTWGGSGLAITKATKNAELAWQFAKFLYLNEPELGKRYLETRILPPFKEAWAQPAFSRPDPFYSNQRVGELLVELANATPAVYASPYRSLIELKLDEAFTRSVTHFKEHGDRHLLETIRAELGRAREYVEEVAARNRVAHAE